MNTLKEVNLKTMRSYDLAAQRYHELFQNEMNEKVYDRRFLNDFSMRFDSDSLICDAGCGPSGHIGRYVFDKGIPVIGIDISGQCVRLARECNPGMHFVCGNIGDFAFPDASFDAIIAYYSIIHTPKKYVDGIFQEFCRVIKPEGDLMVVVKAGQTEGLQSELLDFRTEIYFTLFTAGEIAGYYKRSGFELEFIEKRSPYEFEIKSERIYALGRKRRLMS